jgi:microcystin-dependent protein
MTQLGNINSPVPITANQLQDGLITSVKIADSQITEAKVASGAITSAKIGDGAVTTEKLAASAAIPAGAVQHFARNTAPDGWLKANGAVISRSTYADLFDAIGTTFGVGDGSTTFNLPDLRGEFIRGWDDGRAVDTGRAFGSAQGQEIQSHTHTATGAGFTASGLQFSGGSGYVALRYGGTAADTAGGNINSTGGSETRPRNVALLVCIKY